MNPEECALVCDEMQERTRITCDELSDFQRIISFFILKRHGAWGFSQETVTAQQFCLECGQNIEQVKEKRMAAPLLSGLHRGPRLETPFCSLEELYGEKGCRYTEEIIEKMQSRESFQTRIEPILRRMEKASESIQSTLI